MCPEIAGTQDLVPLLFLEGWRIPSEGLFRDGEMIASLALGIVLVTVFAVVFFIHWLIPTISLSVGLVLASVLPPPTLLRS